MKTYTITLYPIIPYPPQNPTFILPDDIQQQYKEISEQLTNLWLPIEYPSRPVDVLITVDEETAMILKLKGYKVEPVR